MSSRNYRSIGFILLFLAVLCLFAAIIAKPAVGSQISERWPGSNGTYSCANETGVADQIVSMSKPAERATDPATGDTYLRYRKNLIIVQGEGTPECTVTVEGLGRVNSGAFIWLGGGFGPSSPSSSSGGSSGSGGGVK
ncbi:DUF4247 domain-containing protein [Corynebacterium crudilactis]|uniref:DUF4247 domain-containing protein n=1 Tax=Corynebacterium crudilactis TaxID=1652495 RepID=A0A172QVZ5_9CORY|nr:DUF4247 domain-containing protein [Corynebacterium crudilactis]ANE04879.1 hypothetical protein ccrud_12180 [Corynebacterium crudilactis]